MTASHYGTADHIESTADPVTADVSDRDQSLSLITLGHRNGLS